MTHQYKKLPVTMKMWMQFNVMPRTDFAAEKTISVERGVARNVCTHAHSVTPEQSFKLQGSAQLATMTAVSVDHVSVDHHYK